MKNPNLIRNAYQDSLGITARFNLNVLTRINRELGGEFDLDTFDYYSHYNPENGDVRSYVFSLIEQDVKIAAIGKSIHFEKDEPVWMELSKKYSLSGIEQFGARAGFEFKEHFLDGRTYFSDSMFTKP